MAEEGRRLAMAAEAFGQRCVFHCRYASRVTFFQVCKPMADEGTQKDFTLQQYFEPKVVLLHRKDGVDRKSQLVIDARMCSPKNEGEASDECSVYGCGGTFQTLDNVIRLAEIMTKGQGLHFESSERNRVDLSRPFATNSNIFLNLEMSSCCKA